MMYRRSPGSPSAKITCPRGNSTVSSVWASASAAAGSTPWKMPALARVSSTFVPPIRLEPARPTLDPGIGAPDHYGKCRACAVDHVAGPHRRSSRCGPSRMRGYSRVGLRRGPWCGGACCGPSGAAGTAPAHARCRAREQRADLVRARVLQQLLDLVLLDGDVPEPGLHPLHEQGEEHHHDRHCEHEPDSHSVVDPRSRRCGRRGRRAVRRVSTGPHSEDVRAARSRFSGGRVG